jgi:hypothetical protein
MALAVLSAAAGLLVPAGVASAATAAPAHPAAAKVAFPIRGCPYGDACMYTLNGFKADRPEHIYTYDHCFTLHNELGHRWILNAQRGAETVSGYTSSNCTGNPSWVVVIPPHVKEIAKEKFITPINSIRLG